MKKIFFVFTLFLAVFFSLYAQDVFRQEGIASYYGKEFEGRPTASGEIFDPSQLTCAHPTLPFGTMLVVTNQHNNKKVTVRVNDRGPFVAARIIDVSMAAAQQLDMVITGTAPVLIESTEKIAFSAPAQIVDTAQVGAQVNVVVVQPAVDTVVIPEQAVIQPVVMQTAAQATPQIKISPQLVISPNKTYRFQVGSYKNARNAVNAFDKLKSCGFNPAYEKFNSADATEYFRVVVAGVSGNDVQSTAEKLGAAGFKEALIREEN